MRDFRFPIAVSAVAAVFGCVGVAHANVWVDEVVLFDRPSGSSSQGGPATNALGAPDTNFVSIDIPESLILAFTDNTAYDGDGDDLLFVEYINGDSDADFYASQDGIAWTYLGESDDTVAFDLDGTGLGWANFVRIDGLQNGGSSDGYDLDAVEALNSGTYIPEPASLALLGVGTTLLMRRRNA